MTFCQRLRGFKAFRNPSPTSSRAKAVPTMHSPGGIQAQGRVVSVTSSMAFWVRLPQEAWGVRRPTPRKLRLDSDRMARTTFSGSAAHTGAMTLGRSVRNKIARSVAPRAREAST